MFAFVPVRNSIRVVFESIAGRKGFLFLAGVLLFVTLYSSVTLTTKPAYWYDEAMNVELAHNFADFGKLDLVIAPDTFSGQGATVGSTGYTVTVPLAGFFRVFGFGLAEARIYMLLWMGALLIAFFFIAKKLWGAFAAYGGTMLIATFAPFYGNGRSVMGEIPGFLFFLFALYLFERKRWLRSGLLLGFAVVSKPSVFVFLIPAFALALLLRSEAWRRKLTDLCILGSGAVLALIPWFLVYADEISRGGVGASILAHFRNPYAEAGFSTLTNISTNLPTLYTSTTLLYMWAMLVSVGIALFLERALRVEHKNLLILSAVYLPLALLQYLKSFGYLRYFVAAEFLIFILFCITLPALARWGLSLCHYRGNGNPENDTRTGYKNWIPASAGMTVALLVVVQLVQLLWFSDLYASEKTQKTILHIYATYPTAGTIGVINVPQVASFIPSFQKYQFLSTYGLFDFGTHMLYLSPEKLPDVLVTESGADVLSKEEQSLLALRYDRDAFSEGFSVYTKKP